MRGLGSCGCGCKSLSGLGDAIYDTPQPNPPTYILYIDPNNPNATPSAPYAVLQVPAEYYAQSPIPIETLPGFTAYGNCGAAGPTEDPHTTRWGVMGPDGGGFSHGQNNFQYRIPGPMPVQAAALAKAAGTVIQVGILTGCIGPNQYIEALATKGIAPVQYTYSVQTEGPAHNFVATPVTAAPAQVTIQPVSTGSGGGGGGGASSSNVAQLIATPSAPVSNDYAAPTGVQASSTIAPGGVGLQFQSVPGEDSGVGSQLAVPESAGGLSTMEMVLIAGIVLLALKR